MTQYSHEDLYLKASADEIDLVLSYQRQYEKFHLKFVPCRIALSSRNPLAQKEPACARELDEIPCIRIAQKEQQEMERTFSGVHALKKRMAWMGDWNGSVIRFSRIGMSIPAHAP